jgi:uncharacterized protein YbbC (DUF1343 family)
MTHVMEACFTHKKPFILLDRPNPTGIDLSKAEGPMLNEEKCTSFIGRWNIPLKHSCTLGELAKYFAATRMPGLDIYIIPAKDYKRSQKEHNFKFVPTSPAIKNIETAILYPGMGLLEGINVNEGRGTAEPFKKCGTPWLKNGILSQKMQELPCFGIEFTKTEYIPASGLYKGETCKGMQWKLTDTGSYQSVQTGLQLLETIVKLHPGEIKERPYITNANPTGRGHLDKLLGVPDAFTRLKQGEKFETGIAQAWSKTIKPYLLY